MNNVSEPAARHDIGGNMPPDPHDAMRDKFDDDYREIRFRKDDLLAACDRVPATIDDADTARRVTDTIRMLNECRKHAEAARVSEKEPHLAAERAVDGWFKRITEPIDKVKTGLTAKLTTWQTAEADRERRELLAEEARLRDEEAARKKAADEAAAAAEAAEQRKRDAEQAERDAVAAAEAAEQRKLDADKRAAEAEQAERDAAEKRKLDADAEEKEAADKAEREAAEEKEAAEKEQSDAADAIEKAAADKEAAEKDADDAGAEHALSEAVAADTEHEQAASETAVAAVAAKAKPAKLTASRGDLGGHASLRTRTVCTGVDPETLDLETLRPHFKIDALEYAVRRFIENGGRELTGATIKAVSKSVTR